MRGNQGGSAGFTLIELMIVIAVMATLLGIAIPAYNGYIARATRAEAQTLLMRIASEQEKFFTSYNRYSTSITGARTGTGSTSGLAMSATTKEGASDAAWYDVALATDANGLGYTLTATPGGSQASDKCGAMTLNARGVKTAAADKCW